MANVEYIYNEVYKDSDENTFFIFFLYLVKIAMDYHTIKLIKILIDDEDLRKSFYFDDVVAENLVLYMYKLKFQEDPVYIRN